jgi:hypothetical protein
LDAVFWAGKWNHLGVAAGTDAPSLWCVLEVCREIGISPLQLVRGDIDENDEDAAAPEAPADIGLERPPIQHTRIDPVVIRWRPGSRSSQRRITTVDAASTGGRNRAGTHCKAG